MFAPLKASERGKAYYAKFAAWLAENGLDDRVDDFQGRPRRSLVLIPEALQPHADRVDRSVHTFVGACQGDRSATQAPGPGRPTPRAGSSSSSPSARPSPSSPPSTAPAWTLSRTCPTGTSSCRSASSPTSPTWAGSPPTSRCTAGSPSWTSCARPTRSSRTPEREAARKDWPPAPRWSPSPRPSTSSATRHAGLAGRRPARPHGRGRRTDSPGGRPRARRRPEVAARAEAVRAQMATEGGTRQAADLIEAELS